MFCAPLWDSPSCQADEGFPQTLRFVRGNAGARAVLGEPETGVSTTRALEGWREEGVPRGPAPVSVLVLVTTEMGTPEVLSPERGLDS